MDRIEQFSAITGDIGTILRYISGGACLPLVVAVIYDEWDMLLPMASAPVFLFLLGTLLCSLPSSKREARLSQALFAVALIWLICAFAGGMPFTFGTGMPYLDAVFESMSGWTDTGLTLLPDVDATPHTLLFWRSLMQWLGGLGIVAFTVAMASRSGLTEYRLYRSEGRTEAFMPSVVAQGFQMWKIYIILTICSILLIKVSGVPVWDAINIAMVGIATGGFSVHTAGIPYYDNVLLEMLIIPVMLAGALPFKLYYLSYRNKKLGFFKDEQARLLFILFGLGAALLAFDLITFNNLDIWTAIRQGLFMSAAGVTSTGFQVASPGLWAPVSVMILFLLMFIGGSSGSTAGGIKLSRIALGYRGMVWWFRRVFVSGKVLVPFRYEGKVIPKNVAELEVSRNMLVILLYMIIIFAAAVLVMHAEGDIQVDSSNVIFDIITAICNNGISSGFVSPDMSPISKIAFIVIMWVGRLEVMPVIVLVMGLLRGFEY